MTSDVQIEVYSEGDIYRIVDLLKSSFYEWGQNKDPLNYWKWKWIDSPIPSTIHVAKQNENVVAVACRFYYETKLGDSIIRVGYGDDFATHSDFRGRGLFKTLQNISEDEGFNKYGCKMMFAYPNNPITIKSNLKKGKIILPHKIEHIVLINDPYLHYKKMNVKYGYFYSTGFTFLKLLNSLSNIFKSSRFESKKSFQIKQITKFDEKYDAFWNNVKEDYLFINVKNRQYLNWRYADKRGGDYRIYEISEKDQILGYTILEIRETNKYKNGYIHELLSLKNREDVINNLVKHLKREMSELDVNILHFETTSKKMTRTFEQIGFIKSRKTRSRAMYTFTSSNTEKEIFFKLQPEEIYWSYGSFFL